MAEVPHGVTCALGSDPIAFDPALQHCSAVDTAPQCVWEQCTDDAIIELARSLHGLPNTTSAAPACRFQP